MDTGARGDAQEKALDARTTESTIHVPLRQRNLESMSRKRSTIVTCGILVLLAVCYAIVFEVFSNRRDQFKQLAATPAQTSSRSQRSSEERGTGIDVIERAPDILFDTSRPVLFLGKTSDGMTGESVCATIVYGSSSIASDSISGLFYFYRPLGDTVHLEISSEGYEAQSQDVVVLHDSGERPFEVRLRRNTTLTVHVVHEDADPVPGASICKVLGPSIGRRDGEFVTLGKTDDSGTAVVSARCNELLVARLADVVSRIQAVDPAYSTMTLFVPKSGGSRIGVSKDELGNDPIAECRLALRPISAAIVGAYSGETDQRGMFPFLLPPGKYAAHLESPGVMLAGGKNSWADEELFEVAPSTRAYWIVATQSKTVSLAVIDAMTGLPVKEAAIWREILRENKESWQLLEMPRLESSGNGEFQLPASTLASQVPMRIRIWSPSYMATTIDGVQHLVANSRMEARLEAAPRRWLKLGEDPGSCSPIASFVVDESPERLPHCIDWRPSSGRLLMFGWNGGSVRVTQGGAVVNEISKESLETNEVVTISPARTGMIRIQLQAGRSYRLVCVDRSRMGFAGELKGDEIVFRGLPLGNYEVGPPELIDTLPMRSARGLSCFQTDVVDGGEVKIIAPDQWGYCPPKSVRAEVLGADRSSVFMVPLFGDSNWPILQGVSPQRYHIDAAGKVLLPATWMRPCSLSACTLDTNGIDRIVAITDRIENGIAVSMGEVDIEFDDKTQAQSAIVRYTIPFDGREVVGSQVESVHPCARPVKINEVPDSVREVSISVGTRTVVAPVKIRPGEPCLVRFCSND